MGKSILKKDTKIEHFADEYVKNGMNGGAAYRTVVPTAKLASSYVEATRLLQNPKTQKSIADRLPSDKVLSDVIRTAITEKPRDIMDWNTKHKYLTTALKLKGYLNEEHSSSVNVGIFTSKD